MVFGDCEMGLIRIFVLFVRGALRNRAELAAENLALRQQLAILQQKSKTPRLRKRDRIFWALLYRIWTGWRSALLIVQLDIVVGWHRQGFKLYWRWKSRTANVGRPKIGAQSVLRTPRRFDPPRVPRSCHRPQRTTPAAHPAIVLRLLPALANASLVRTKLAN